MDVTNAWMNSAPTRKKATAAKRAVAGETAGASAGEDEVGVGQVREGEPDPAPGEEELGLKPGVGAEDAVDGEA